MPIPFIFTSDNNQKQDTDIQNGAVVQLKTEINPGMGAHIKQTIEAATHYEITQDQCRKEEVGGEH